MGQLCGPDRVGGDDGVGDDLANLTTGGNENRIRSKEGEFPLPKCYGHLREQYCKVHKLLKRTIFDRESDTALLIGPRGSGKSLVVNKALESLQRLYRSLTSRPPAPTPSRTTNSNGKENKTSATSTTNSAPPPFRVIRLNGLVQTDDKIALREMTRQLRLEDEMEKRKFTSYADCLSFILETLSNASTITSSTRVKDTPQLPATSSTSDPPSTTSSPQKQNEATKQSRPIPLVILLDEFDLFAGHPKQGFLYTLFDVVMHGNGSGVPVAIVGATCRQDVEVMLEKRVKSRFSHRHILFSPPPGYVAFLEVLEERLTLKQPRVLEFLERRRREEEKRKESEKGLEDEEDDEDDDEGVIDVDAENEKVEEREEVEVYVKEFNEKVKYTPVSRLAPPSPFRTQCHFPSAHQTPRAAPNTSTGPSRARRARCGLIAMVKLHWGGSYITGATTTTAASSSKKAGTPAKKRGAGGANDGPNAVNGAGAQTVGRGELDA
ncbi:origin recognition complex subunit 4, partial [Quaeritorhiza haematococci]